MLATRVDVTMARVALRRCLFPALLTAIAFWSSLQLPGFAPVGRGSNQSLQWLKRSPVDVRLLQDEEPKRAWCLDGLQLWRHLLSAGCAALVVLAQVAPVFAGDTLATAEQQRVALYKKCSPSVVLLGEEAVGDTPKKVVSKEELVETATGWVYDKEGHIISNWHVVKNQKQAKVTFIDGTQVLARVLRADSKSDVALLQVDLPEEKKALLRPLSLGSAAVEVGQDVFCLGNPFGLGLSFSKGIVTGVGRNPLPPTYPEGPQLWPLLQTIQTNAPANPGSSGGPILNSNGEVIGMTALTVSTTAGTWSGATYAIPSDLIAAEVSSILKYGYVKRPGLGVYLEKAQEGAAEKQPGCRVVFLTSPSASASLRPGDIVREVAGKPTRNAQDLYIAVNGHRPGEEVEVKVLRTTTSSKQGAATSKELTVKVELTEVRPSDAREL